MTRLAIVTTHPIQYYSPLYKLLAEIEEIEVKVFYTWGKHGLIKFDPGFEKTVEWDLPILNGYNYEFLENTSKEVGSHHFFGIKNTNAIEEIKQFSPDIILIYGWAYHSHLKILRYFKGKIPVWFRGDSTLMDNKGIIKNIARKVVLRYVYSHIDRALYVGSNNKAYFKKYGVSDKKLTFAPHAVDNIRFAQDQSEDAFALRKNLEIPLDAKVILFAGKLENHKNPLLLLNAFLNIDIPDSYLLIVGSGPLEGQLRALARSQQTIHFMPFQNQSSMPIMYQACDLFCLPSLSETWGLAVNEAMAAGKAILASNKVGCAKDLIIEDYNGKTFKSGNLEDLIKTLKHLLSKKVSLKTMGQKSQDLISNWTLNRQAQIISELISSQ